MSFDHDVRWTFPKLQRRIALIANEIHRTRVPLPAFSIQKLDHVGPLDRQNIDPAPEAWTDIPSHSYWGEWRMSFVLKTGFSIPETWIGKGPVSVLFDIGEAGDFVHPEALVYVDGQRIAACDRFHTEIVLPENVADGARHDLLLHGWTGNGSGETGFGQKGRQLFMGESALSLADEELRAFVARARVALGIAEARAPADMIRQSLLNALDRAFMVIDTRQPLAEHLPSSLARAREILDAGLDGIDAGEVPHITAVGHAHIDLAWMWTTDQTRQKGARTFSTVMALMDRFPDYTFTQSQPQLYDWIRQDYPALFSDIRRRVAEKRWEPTGGMWVEADCNLSGGEALARQFLLGRTMFAEMFGEGVDTPVLWLPDVFGYAWSLPQLIKLAGLQYFFTIKIGWNQYDRLPFDSFWWQGMDGTRVLTHFSPTPGETKGEVSTYNAVASPYQAVESWNNYQQKHINAELLMSFGHGDGGGGPTAEMMENIREMGWLKAAPDVHHGFAGDFFKKLEETAGDRLPVWNGELYLEYHRGTYTTQANNKRNNRKAEFGLHDAELLATMAALEKTGYAYPYAEFDRLWKLVCLNQFHDIIPGSSIAEVYAESDRAYADIFASLEILKAEALAVLGAKKGEVLLVNPTGFVRQDIAETALDLPDGAVLVDASGRHRRTQKVGTGTLVETNGLAPLSLTRCAVVKEGTDTPSELSVGTDHLENGFLRVEFDAAGDITRLYDKTAAREVLAKDAIANQFQLFEDRPLKWEAWDIDLFYADRMWTAEPATSIRVVEQGPLRVAVSIERKLMSSTIRQVISLGSTSARLDFATEIDWQERQMLLKVAFPVEVFSPVATFDVQWGNVERPTHRNTSWDWARFETCAHKWVDLSEGDYGVSLLNESKYGHDVFENTLRLTLLRSPIHPDPEADRGVHRFSYALLPHAGRWDRHVLAEAYGFNDPVIAIAGEGDPAADLPAPFVICDNPNVVIETVKMAEDGKGVIVRLYETFRTRGKVRLTPAFAITGAAKVNLLEETIERVGMKNDTIVFDVRPFEIVTLRLEI